MDDVQPGEHLNRQKKTKIDEGYRQCHDLISLFAKGALALHPGCNAAETLEHKITGVLNEIRTAAGNVSLHQVSSSCLFLSQLACEQLLESSSPLVLSNYGEHNCHLKRSYALRF